MASNRFAPRSLDASIRSINMLKTSTALGSILVLASLAGPAYAENECGTPTGGVVTCTVSGNPYPNGISYITQPDPLTINIDPGVAIDTRGTYNLGVTAISGGPSGPLIVDAATGSSITTDHGGFGVLAESTYGDVSVTTDKVTTSGDNGFGIVSGSSTGAVSVTAGTTRTDGAGATGIQATTNSGAVTISGGTVSTSGAGATGIYGHTDTADVAITFDNVTTSGGANGFFNSGANGVVATSSYGGNVGITGGTISTAGDNAIGALATTFSGNATVDTDSVTTKGAGADAIDATSRSGAVTVTGGAISTTGDNARGIVASGGNGITIGATSISTSGNGATGILVPAGSVYSGTPPTTTATIDGGNISTTGDNADGISVTTTGIATVNNDDAITTAGNNGRGIYANGGGGVVISGTGSVTTGGSHSDGIVATSNGGDVSVAQNTVWTTGDYSHGVVASSTGAGNVDVNVDTVTTTGTAGSGFFFLPNSAGIVATAGSGDVTVTNGSVSTAGLSATGIRAGSYTGNVTVNSGDVTTTGGNATGIQATGNYGGDVAVTSTGTVSTAGDSAYGIYAGARQGAVSVTAGTVQTQGFNSDAIRAIGGTSSDVTFGNISTAGTFASGIDAEATGNVTVSGGDVSTTAVDAPAIYAFSDTGNASVTTTGTVATTGASSRGIYAYSNIGDATVVANNVTTTGDNSDAIIATGANASVIVSGNVSTQGTRAYSSSNANAILATATDGVATVVNNGSVSTAGDDATAIVARGTQGVTISGTGSVATTGYNALGIDASSTAGPVSVATGNISTRGDFAQGIRAQGNGGVTVNTGNVTTAGALAIGMQATGLGTDPVSVTTGAVKTSGDNAAGVLAYSSGGPVTINAGSVATTGANAVGVQGRGAGAVSITTGTASSASREAVYAGSFTDAATVTLNGATSGTGGNAVFIAAATDATLNVGANGSLIQAGGNVDLIAGDTATVNNAGTITGDGTAPIINVFNATPLTFNNSGTFTGTIGFATGSDDTVNNSGTYNAKYDQDFAAGTDTFNNSGTFKVLPGAAAAGTVHLTGLEAFNNSGLVDLRNGHAGDALDTSSTFRGTGNSQLGIDVAFAKAGSASLADHLTAAGAVTGSTALLINQVGANGAILNSGTVFATGGAGSSATAFTIVPASLNQGFIQYGVAFNAANNTYSLVGTPGDAVFRALKINEGAQQLWYKSAEAWSSHMSDLRDAKFAGGGADGGRMWGQFYGSTVTRNGGQTVSAFGQSRTVELSYKQDAYGAQLGLDLGSREMGSGNFVFGVTGGYLNSDLTFARSADRVNYSVVNLGAYASYVSGSLFANVLGKYDYIWANSKSPLAGYADKFHGMSYGAQGEIGIRFGGDSFYAEPVATIAYVRTDLKNIYALGQTIDFDKLDGLRGKAGLRIGSKRDMGGGSVAVLYAQGNYVHEFKGKNGIDFISGGQSLAYNNDRIQDYGEGKIGINVTTAAGVTGFIEGFGDYAKHGDYKGGGGRAGIRVKL